MENLETLKAAAEAALANVPEGTPKEDYLPYVEAALAYWQAKGDDEQAEKYEVDSKRLNKNFSSEESAILADVAKHCGFGWPDFLDCQAGIWRLKVLSESGYFDRFKLADSKAFSEKNKALIIQPEKEFSAWDDPKVAASYKIFPDGSLYFSSNAEDEVWAEAEDFVREKILPNADPKNLAKIDWQLIADQISTLESFHCTGGNGSIYQVWYSSALIVDEDSVADRNNRMAEAVEIFWPVAEPQDEPYATSFDSSEEMNEYVGARH